MILAERRENSRSLIVALAVGLSAGVGFAVLASASSPLVALLGVAGLSVALAVYIEPAWGLLLTALVIPLERLGRFTPDSSMYTVSLMRVVGVLALGGFLVHALVKKWKLQFGAPFLLYAGYSALALLGVVHTSDPLGTVRACGAILGNLLFFFLVINLVREWRMARIAVLVWLMATTAIGLYVVYDWHFGPQAVESESGIGETASRFSTVWTDSSEWESLNRVARAMGTTSHAAVYGINLILTLPFFLWILKTAGNRRAALAAMGALGLVLYNVMLTNTRAAILLAGGVLVLSAVKGLIKLRPSWILGGLVLAVLTLPVVPQAIFERVLDLGNYSYQRSGTLRIRLEYWQAGLQVAEDHWLTGVGVGNQTEIPKRIKGYGPKQTTVHSEYLQTLLEVGLLGFLLFFSFVALLMWCAFRAARLCRALEPDGERYWFLVACQVAMVAVLVYGIQVDVFHFPLKGWWLVGALSWALYQLARQSGQRGRPAGIGSVAT